MLTLSPITMTFFFVLLIGNGGPALQPGPLPPGQSGFGRVGQHPTPVVL